MHPDFSLQISKLQSNQLISSLCVTRRQKGAMMTVGAKFSHGF